MKYVAIAVLAIASLFTSAFAQQPQRMSDEDLEVLVQSLEGQRNEQAATVARMNVALTAARREAEKLRTEVASLKTKCGKACEDKK